MQPVTDQPVGVTNEKAVMVYWLPLGLATVMVTVGVAPPVTGLLDVTVTEGREAFEANAFGAKAGIRTSMPESASNARIVPELNFVTYALDCVFNIFGRRGRRGVFRDDGRFVYFSPRNAALSQICVPTMREGRI